MSIDTNAPEVLAAIKAAVEEATTGLAAKNKELLAELKAAKKGREVDPEMVSKLEDRIEELTSQVQAAQTEAKAKAKEAEKASKALADAEGFTHRLLVDNGLSDALAKAGVTNPAHLKAVRSMLSPMVAIAAEGDSRIAKVGDKALSEFVAEWAAGDEGKHFVSAPANSGGGASGSSGSSGGKSFKDMSSEERVALYRSNPAQYEALKSSSS